MEESEPFAILARYNELEEMQQVLITNPEQLNSCTDDGNTALHYASANGNLEIAKFLLSRKTISLNPQNIRGNTPLHWAALNGHEPVVQALIDAGCDARIKNADNRSATTLAEQQGHLQVVNILLKSYEPSPNCEINAMAQDMAKDLKVEE